MYDYLIIGSGLFGAVFAILYIRLLKIIEDMVSFIVKFNILLGVNNK